MTAALLCKCKSGCESPEEEPASHRVVYALWKSCRYRACMVMEEPSSHLSMVRTFS